MPRRNTTLVISSLILLAALSGLGASDDIDPTVLKGVVTDAEGVALPGASVKVSCASTAVARELLTDNRGRYRFSDLLPATDCVLRVYLAGSYAIVTLNRIVIQAGKTHAQDVQLIKKATEEVVVSAKRNSERVVDLKEVGQVTEFTSDFIERQPLLGRNYQDILTLASGVVDPSGSPSPNVLGARAEQLTFNTESYDRTMDNSFRAALRHPLSTFAIDVDTASYSNVRRFLTHGGPPPQDAVRIEEMINYFDYDYPAPDGDHPFSVDVEATGCPWTPQHRLVRIGLKGDEMAARSRPPASLIFLLDVSGSMASATKLPLVKRSLRMLVDALDPGDTVAIVVYAGAAGMVLPATSVTNKEVILDALEHLAAGGSTAGGAGLRLAYMVARENFLPGGTNRVILATDGDFNVGVSSNGALTRMIEKQARSGVFFTVLGFGMGNLKDDRLEKLADKGNGHYAYIDSLFEARKVLVEEVGSTLVTIAKDVKIQVEFNPALVQSYRLIGYENRLLRDEDFDDDAKDAGEIGAGHTVTALYEIVPAGEEIVLPDESDLRYQRPSILSAAARSGELLTVKIRYKAPDGTISRLMEVPVIDSGGNMASASTDTRFAAAVACLGLLLRDSPHRGTASYGEAERLAMAGLGDDTRGHRARFIEMVRQARSVADERP